MVFIPRNGMEAEGNLSLVCVSTIDNSERFNAVVIDIATSARFFNLAVELPEDAMPGEYEYTLSDSVKVLTTGLLQVGEYDSKVREYNKTIEYEQYRAE